ncbi:hypothetical protein [Rhizobium bangladeshense]|uniref:hypothetical protein n=1 Tax=Rhizobium bangladeshense TaxID=1138189 RepID=UPI001A98C77D|nr:hypothetical protein [Rhizobium bangladeshense]MBX4892823.1 hypothetical protein [Rhizobium bangladeshense]MBX4898455.1 hypothetical protein [Rhizobium bangladeshense]MBX4902846.1 hypothetical protein [Rhizobium bangladeshense]MBX4914692.1 hypothetical protein [Rhizobium bangladeshense]MBX4918232.1 hypothetical protein [Rhizobium bangladeshense]
MELDQHRLTSSIAASLLFAILAYMGLLFGGNLIVSPATAVNTLSSSGRDPQPQQLSARDAVRGVLAAERKLAPKQTAYDAGTPTLAAAPAIDFAVWCIGAPLTAFEPPLHRAVSRAHQARAPPIVA